MAETAVAGGLMTHQKDEHDIWICKECRWKYPNAKPSPKIRKNHKKHCPGKAGGNGHSAGGSSEDASDEDHHVHLKESAPPSEAAVDAPVPPVEVKSRELDFASLKAEASSAEAAVVNGAAQEAPAHTEASIPAAVPVSPGGLMPHQKDEHDIWICKECGWKYPNAKPSSKIRKNHKKHCPGKGGPVATGGSSEEASDDEHHHAPVAQEAPVESGREESASTAPSPAEAPTSISREIDFAALKESSAPEAIPDTDISPEAGNGTKEFSPAAPEPVGSAVPQEALVPEADVPDAEAVSRLMLHQKDEHDIWVCKDCGWKYPNAKPSPKIRKNHRKKCTGKNPGAAGTTGGSSDEASDDEHHHHHHSPAPAAPVVIHPAVESGKEDPATVPEAPESISRETDFAALKESSNAAVEKQTPAANTAETTPAVSATGIPTVEDMGAVSLKEALSKETDKETEAPAKPVSLQEAINKETEKEKDSATGGAGGLMLHQKHEFDVWVCKECGWKYPNAKPSPKIRNNHKKKCPGHSSNGASLDEASHDGALDHEDHSTAETATDKDVKDSIPAVSEAEVPDIQIKSREFSLKDALQTSDAAPPASEEKVTEKEVPGEGVVTEQAPPTTVGDLMPNQKHEGDVWTCKACGWRYPNAKPSAKIRNNHKKKCPKQDDEEKKINGGKCFPCL